MHLHQEEFFWGNLVQTDFPSTERNFSEDKSQVSKKGLEFCLSANEQQIKLLLSGPKFHSANANAASMLNVPMMLTFLWAWNLSLSPRTAHFINTYPSFCAITPERIQNRAKLEFLPTKSLLMLLNLNTTCCNRCNRILLLTDIFVIACLLFITSLNFFFLQVCFS